MKATEEIYSNTLEYICKGSLSYNYNWFSRAGGREWMTSMITGSILRHSAEHCEPLILKYQNG